MKISTMLLTISLLVLNGSNCLTIKTDDQQNSEYPVKNELNIIQTFKQISKQQYQAMKTSYGNEQGLSKNYHGHIEQRQELHDRHKEKENPNTSKFSCSG
ncbi:hypothetical protein WQ54_23740 [Bacillus sp. SA1-12]|uniref:hypothetical protein n=1 Tax=Bacillus sp. SA1-12 TaxID=1455638 RepID=UPI00062729D7|nr:hypothetical protein WQ54_23740 [Bacillus sp. SA1-12]